MGFCKTLLIKNAKIIIAIIVPVRAPDRHPSIDNTFVPFRTQKKTLITKKENEFFKPLTNTSNEKRRAEALLNHTVCSELIPGELLSSRAHVLFSSNCNLVTKMSVDI